MQKLTSDQCEMIESNHNLIYWYANRRRLDIDEWYGLLAEQLCHAVMKFDPEKGTLPLLFKMRCDVYLHREFGKKNKRNSHQAELLDNVDYSSGSDEYNSIQIETMLEAVDSKVIRMWLDGYTQAEIADVIGVNQPRVSTILKRDLEACRRYWNE